MGVRFYVNSICWFEGNKTNFLGWLELKDMPKSGDEILYKYTKDLFKIISVAEDITGTISVYAQIKID